jgi:hypothetical protein
VNLKLAIVTTAGSADCTLRWLDDRGEHLAHYSPAMQGRIKIVPRQLVAVDTATTPPTVMWRWFRGIVILRRDDYVVVDNQIYQPGFRIPISVMRLPDVLEVDVPLGAEVFYSHEPHGAVIDVVVDDVPAHPARLAADMFPAIADVYAELRERGRA